MNRRWLATVAIVSVVAPPALAEAPDARARRLLTAGEKLFADQEYPKAVKVLVAVTRDAAAPRSVRVRAWELIALARFIDGDEGGARDACERLLEADPGFQLRDTSGSPRIRRFFDQIRAEVVPAADTEDVDLEQAAPRGAIAGRNLEIEVRATRGSNEIRQIVVLHRRLGALAYDERPARAAGDDRWRAAVALPSARRAYEVEYYVEARGVAGAVLARIATPDSPLSLRVSPGGDLPRAWYGRWYVIAGAAAVAAGATGAVVWAVSGGVDDGSLPPGRVIVTE